MQRDGKKCKKTNKRIRQSDEAMNEKPLEAIAKESHESSDEENNPERKMKERETRAPAKGLSHVWGHREIVQLKLSYLKHRFQIRRVRWEIEVRAGECLQPYRRTKNHPFSWFSHHRIFTIQFKNWSFITFCNFFFCFIFFSQPPPW